MEFYSTSIGGTINYIIGTKKDNESDYLAYQLQNSGGYRLWGYGITWGNSSNLIGQNNVIRSVIVFTVSNNTNASATNYFANITSGTTNTFTNSYSTSGTTYDVNPIYIGKYGSSPGFVGTMNKCIINEGEWSAEQIANFLAGN